MDSPLLYRQSRDVVEEALQYPPAYRSSFVRSRVGSNVTLSEQVEQLLSFEHDLAGFLTEPLFPRDSSALPAPIGRRIGPYEIECELARGGMGIVYLAKRADDAFEQWVAVKMVRRGDEEAMARFRRERQITVQLDHPAIAKVFDGGTTEDEQPYFVMELIDGQQIDEACQRGGLPASERVELLLGVCEGVSEAHKNLIVHLDLKPANILIDRRGQPKLLDFGIAKPLIGADETAATTAPFASVHYASPEQLRGARATVATDVYSLGVLLYQLVSGSLPFGSAAGLPAILEAKKEPLPASFEVTAETPAAEKGWLATARGPEQEGEEVGVLNADLLAVLRKATAYELDRRYPAVGAFADDLRAVLDKRPVNARPATRLYRASKFLDRHRLPVAFSLFSVLALLGLILALVLQSSQLEAERDLARRERTRAEEVTRFLEELFLGSNPSEARGRTLLAREVLDEGEVRLRSSGELDPETRASLKTTIGVVYRNLGLYEESEPLLREALQARRELLGEAHPATLRSRRELAEQLRLTGRFELAGAELATALNLATAPDLTPGPRPPGLVQRLRSELAATRTLAGLYDEAEALFDRVDENALGAWPLVEHTLRRARLYRDLGHLGRSRELTAKARGRSLLLGTDHPSTLHVLVEVAALYLDLGELAEAASAAAEALVLAKKLYGPRHREVASATALLADVRRTEGELDAASALLEQAQSIRREVLGEDHPDIVSGLNGQAKVERDRGDYEAASKILDEAIDKARAVLGADHPELWRLYEEKATVHLYAGRLAAAQEIHAEILELQRQVLGDRHRDTASSIANFARALSDAGKHQPAAALYPEAISTLRSTLGSEHPKLASTLNDYGILLGRLQRPEEAEAVTREALAIRRARYGDRHSETAETMTHLGLLLRVQYRFDEAAELLSGALEILRENLGPSHPELASAMNNAALVYNDQQKYQLAVPLYREAATLMRKTLGSEHPNVGFVLLNLALALSSLDQPEEALATARESAEILTAALGEEHWAVAVAQVEQGSAMVKLGRHCEAEQLFLAAFAQLSDQLGRESRFSQSTARRLAKLYEADGRIAEAKRFRAMLLNP